MKFLGILLGICGLVPLVHTQAWGYFDGPADQSPPYWYTNYPVCAGNRQSPVNIVPHEAEYDSSLAKDPLRFENYDTVQNELYLYNNGYTITVLVEDPASNGIAISGAQLSGRYILSQFHLHWGRINSVGAEHTINGEYYPAVIHFVHIKQDYLSDPSILDTVGDGAAAVGVFIKVGQHNSAFDNIIANLEMASAAGTTDDSVPVNLPALKAFLPEDTSDFYRYYGSLTTPECTETVIWTVMKHHIEMSQAQLERFRTIKKDKNAQDGPDNQIKENWRPIQPLHGRVIYTSCSDYKIDDVGAFVGLFFAGLALGVLITVIIVCACVRNCRRGRDDPRKMPNTRVVTQVAQPQQVYSVARPTAILRVN